MPLPTWTRDVLSWHRTGSRWSPVRTLPVTPLWCDLGFFPNSRGIKSCGDPPPWQCLTGRQPQIRPAYQPRPSGSQAGIFKFRLRPWVGAGTSSRSDSDWLPSLSHWRVPVTAVLHVLSRARERTHNARASTHTHRAHTHITHSSTQRSASPPTGWELGLRASQGATRLGGPAVGARPGCPAAAGAAAPRKARMGRNAEGARRRRAVGGRPVESGLRFGLGAAGPPRRYGPAVGDGTREGRGRAFWAARGRRKS